MSEESATPTPQKKLDRDDPAAGTIDDPNVDDPYAHLRRAEQARLAAQEEKKK